MLVYYYFTNRKVHKQNHITLYKKMQKTVKIKQNKFQQTPNHVQINQFLDELKCTAKNKVTHVCCSNLCDNSAFLCNDESCQCGEKHEECVRFSLKKIVQKIQGKILDLTPLIQEHHKYIDRCIDTLIDQASKIKDKFQDFVEQSLKFCQLSFDQGVVLQSLEKNKVQKLKGRQFYHIHKGLFSKQKPSVMFDIQQQKKRISKLCRSFQRQSLSALQSLQIKLYESEFIDQNVLKNKNNPLEQNTKGQEKSTKKSLKNFYQLFQNQNQSPSQSQTQRNIYLQRNGF